MSDPQRRKLSEAGWQVEDHALIALEQLPVKAVPATTWIFFSSAHAVRFFSDLKPDLKNTKLGAVGPATGQTCQEVFHKCDFVGQGNSLPGVGQAFQEQLRPGNSVLFPASAQGKKTLQNYLPHWVDIHDLILYQTLANPIKIASCEAYVFTSPMNVEAFFMANSLPADARVCAIGRTTQETLRAFGIDATVPSEHSVDGLIEQLIG